eukprot:55567_1
MLSSFLAALIVTARSTTLLDFGCSAGDTCSEIMPFLTEENAKSENPVPDALVLALTPTCNTDDGYCSIDCAAPFSFACASVPEGQIVVNSSVVYCDPSNAWCAVDLTCTSDIDCTAKLPRYKCASTGACIPSSSTECTDNSDCTTDGIRYCDTRTYSGVTVSFCDQEPCANTDDCFSSGYVCGESAVCLPSAPTTAEPTPPSVNPTQLVCGFVVVETNGETFPRPLDVCSNSFGSNGSITESMMITCNDNVYTRIVYDDDSCNGTVTSSETVGENCIESVDCVCGVGSECEYATWTQIIDGTCDGVGNGTSYIEMAVIVNECIECMDAMGMYGCDQTIDVAMHGGVMYGCDGDTLRGLLWDACGEGAENMRGLKGVCDLECNEGEVTVTTTEMAQIETTLRTTKGIETTEEGKVEAKSKKTVIIIGSVIGAFLLALIVIGVCLYCTNRNDKPGSDTSGYGAVGGNETENEDVEMGAETR